MQTIVSATWLHQHIEKSNLIILDASMAFHGLAIPQARLFDLDHAFADTSSPFPNTVPKPEQFEMECQKLGIDQDSQIVVYDNKGIYTSPRVWWLFQIMGHKNIAVLDGGLPAWIENGFETVSEHFKPTKKGNYKSEYQKDMVITFDQIKANIDQQKFVVVDARSAGRFNGTAPEPRKHLKSGSIPNSVNLPFEDVLDSGKFKSEDEIKKLFQSIVKDHQELVFSCGSGITASIILLASVIGYKNSLKLYDGSWTEWAELNQLTTN